MWGVMAENRVIITAAICAAAAITGVSYAQDAKSWDGTWTGYWNNRSFCKIIISGGKLVEYDFGAGRDTNLTLSEANATSFAFHSRFMHVTLTKTGETTASAQYGNIKGGSGGTVFTRQ